ncbi:MAG: murein biosynthesis integral membrane protein MurJ [Myxococcota bacterium]
MGSSERPPRYPADGPLSTEAVDGVARSAGVVGGATLASRVLGLLRDVVLAGSFLPGATDAFFIAFMIPNLFRRLVAEGSLTVSFVPVFTTWLSRSREEAREVLDATWTLAALVGLVLTILGIFFADELVSLFAPGFALDEGKHELSVALLRLCFPYILLLMLVAVAMGALNALGHFLYPALAPVLLNVSLITAALLGFAFLEQPILALGWGVLIAGVLQVLIQLPPLRARGFTPRRRFAPRDPAMRRLGRLMGPAILGASVFQLNIVVARFLSSFLGDGAVSYLYYADRLLEFPLGVFVFALGTASLPSFARLAKGDPTRLREAFSGTLRLALALSLPSTVGLILVREEIFRVLFAWNPSVFGEAAVLGCARALGFFALGLVPITVSRICVALCFAHEEARLPARAAVIGFLVHLITALALIGPLPEGVLPASLIRFQHALVLVDLGYAGLAAAASVAALVNALYLLWVVGRRFGPLLGAADALGVLRLGAGCAVLALGVFGARWLLPAQVEAGIRGLAMLSTFVLAGTASYVAALVVLGSPELRSLAKVLSRRPRS